MSGELAGILAFIPVFWVLTVALIALNHGLGRVLGVKAPDGIGAIVALALTILILVWLDCAIFVSLPFGSPACRMLGF